MSETGALPSGVTFVDNGDGTATLAGTPAAGTSRSYPLQITASNGVSPDAVQSFVLTVDQPPTITSANSTTFETNQAGSFTVDTSGYPAPAMSETGALPSGVTFVDNGDGTATLAGTPDAGTGGIYPLQITASNGVSPDAVQSFVLTVDQPPAITSANSATFVNGETNSFTVTATGFPAPTFSEIGALPTGVTLSSGGVLSGTPSQLGSFPIAVTATNGVSPDASQSFLLTVNQSGTPPTITSVNNATFIQGQPGTFTMSATGSPPPTFSETGTLPSGIALTSAGVLSGTTDQSGSFSLTIKASNGVSPDATQSFSLTVTMLFQISTSSLPPATPGQTYAPVQLHAIGQGPGATLKWKKAGTLPKGLKLTSTGVLSGTPNVKLVVGTNQPVPVKVTETVITKTVERRSRRRPRCRRP